MSKKFKVTHEYRGKVTVEVEAETPEEAENNRDGMDEAEAILAGNLSLYNSTSREIHEK